MRLLHGVALVALPLTGCLATDGADETRVQGIAIPGPWMPPASTIAIARTQHVDVVDPPAVSPLGSCSSSDPFRCSCTHPACTPAHPGTRELDAFLRARYPYLRPGGLYCCRQNSAATSVPYLSVHSIGRAIDLMVPMIGGDADNTLGDPVANWLVENAEYIGVQRVIWDRWFWNGERGFGALSSASLPHTNHIHLELSTAGAARLTPFFTSGASTMATCTPHCEGTRVINADCSSVDCGGTGATCVNDGSVHCGEPPPPEGPSTAVPGAGVPTVRALAAPSRIQFVTPGRMFDTRVAADSTRLVRSDGSTASIGGAVTGTFSDWSAYGFAAGSSGAWINVAAVTGTAAGFATFYPAGQSMPATSNVNFGVGGVRANAALVPFGAAEGVVFSANTPVDLICDVYAAFGPTGAGLDMSGPTRLLDTRGSVALTTNTPYTVNIPAPAGSIGMVGTIAVISRGAPGFLRAAPCGSDTPTSTINFAPNSVVSNAFVAGLGGGQLCLLSNADVDAIVDVTGYFSPTGTLSYVGLAPERLLDTREPTSLYTGRLDNRQVIELPIQSLPGMPADVGAVVVNVTAVGSDGPGFLSVYACGRDVPATSSLNYPAGGATGGLVLSAIENGSLCVFAFSRAHVIVDVMGVWTRTAGTMPPPDAGMTGNPTDNGDDLDPSDPDAGEGGAVVTDASSGDAGGDASTMPPASGGCGCRTAAPARPSATWGYGMVLAMAGVIVRRRRRAR